MTLPVRILHLEDDPADGELIATTLRHHGVDCSIQLAATRLAFEEALAKGGLDLILADYHLPSFDGLEAMRLCRQIVPSVPFLFVSGFIDEEVALESLKQGATDYVYKHNLARLVPAVRRALQEAEAQRVRLRAEAALLESEATLRSFFHTAPFLMGIVELLPDDLLHESVNAATARFFGLAAEAMQHRTTRELGMPAPVRERWLHHCRESHRFGRPMAFEVAHRAESRTCHLAVTVSELPPLPGRAPRFCFVAEDVTDKKQLEQQFLRSQRLESIGTLASGIAHDLNNVLAPILMSLKLFRPRLTDPEDQELLRTIEASAQRGADIVRQVLTFARGVEGERRPLDLNRLVGDLEKIIRDTFPRSVHIETLLAGDLRQPAGDATQVYQVLMNLCVNARDAMPEGGRLMLRAENARLDEQTARFHPEARPGDYVVLSVADTGGGIPSELMARIFDPFFTTKKAGQGTGLGLPTALTIVKSHGGFIHAYSETGRGSEFKVYLPAQASSAVSQAGPATPEIPRGHGELILVVDDEPTIRQVTRATLIEQGYDAITARDGTEALALFGQMKGRIKLVITDMMMPLMDGSALIRALQELDPGARILAVSGLLDGSAPPQIPRTTQVSFLSKPFTAEKLLLAIDEILHRADTPLLL